MLRAAIVLAVAAFVIPPPAAAQDAERGAALYGRCGACHSVDRNRTGPRHCGVFGRAAGTQPGFRYSPALARSGLTWDGQSLDAFLADPRGVVPGTRMTIAGIADPGERADLVAYLRQLAPCP